MWLWGVHCMGCMKVVHYGGLCTAAMSVHDVHIVTAR